MRRRVNFLLSASFGLAVWVLLTPAGFTVQGWVAPLAEGAWAHRHPVAATALAATAPWMIAGLLVRWWRPVLRPPAVFALLSWTLVAVPVTAITIREARSLHEWPGTVVGRAQLRTPPARAVDTALAMGDCRPFAISGFGPVVPLVSDLAEAQRERFWTLGLRFIYDTSDLVLSGDQRHRERAYRYAERYNRHLLARLRAPDGGLDWGRCRAGLSR